jgi:hypothetical protein
MLVMAIRPPRVRRLGPESATTSLSPSYSRNAPPRDPLQ